MKLLIYLLIVFAFLWLTVKYRGASRLLAGMLLAYVLGFAVFTFAVI